MLVSRLWTPKPGEFDPAVSMLRDPRLRGIDRRGRAIWDIAGGADTALWRDVRQPYTIADQSAITLASTQKALWTPALTILPANYWYVGKIVKLTAFIKAVTGTTPGNYAFAMAYGAGDAPAPIVASVARAAVASQTSVIMIEGYAICRSIGTAGTLSMWGHARADLALMLSTNQPSLFPSGGTTVVSTIDTTVGTNAVTFQMSRSGSTAETAAAVGLVFEALN
jgi:hypothetical protein